MRRRGRSGSFTRRGGEEDGTHKGTTCIVRLFMLGFILQTVWRQASSWGNEFLISTTSRATSKGRDSSRLALVYLLTLRINFLMVRQVEGIHNTWWNISMINEENTIS